MDDVALPLGWKMATLGEATTTKRRPGGILDGVVRIPFIPMSLLPENGLYASEHEMREPGDVRSGVRIEEGDFLLAKITPCLENGKQGIVRGLPGGYAYATTEVFPLQMQPGVLPEFVASYLRVPAVRHELAGKMQGATGRQRLPKDALEALPIPLPPLSEQRAITHALTTVQRAREATEAVIAAARELKRSLMRHLFTYGTTRSQQAGQVAVKGTGFGRTPEHWNVLPLEQCANVQTGAAKGRRFGDEDTITVPYLRVANVQDGYLDLSEIKDIRIRRSELQRYSLQPGDVLLTEGGDFDKLGRGFVWEAQMPVCVHQNHIFAVRTDRSRLLPHYLAYLAQSDYGKAYFLMVAHRTTHLACINSTKLRALPVPLPALEEQQCIAHQLKTVDRKIEAEEKRRTALDELFRSLLQQLMTGQVRLDPATILEEAE